MAGTNVSKDEIAQRFGARIVLAETKDGVATTCKQQRGLSATEDGASEHYLDDHQS